MTQNDEKLLRILNDNWRKLEKAMQGLEYSIEKCDAIGFRHIYIFDEKDAFDALASKFARNSGILFQKIFKTIIYHTKEDAPSFIDKVNLLSKINLLQNSDDALIIREFRNQIVHEYFDEDIIILYPKLLDYLKKLVKLFEETKHFLIQRNWILS